jgi:hypothetical protein
MMLLEAIAASVVAYTADLEQLANADLDETAACIALYRCLNASFEASNCMAACQLTVS